MGVAVTAPHLPELPRVYVDTTYSLPGTTPVSVSSLAALQTAINAASPGDVISLALGSYSGTLSLPVKSGSSYIYIVSANLASLPAAGVRVGLADAANMPKITSPGSNASAVVTQAGAHHFRFVGIEFTCPSGDDQGGLIRFGTGSEDNAVIAASGWVHHLILDRCIVHGHATTGGRRGVLLAGNYLGVVDSYLYDWKKTDAQCQAIAGWTGLGPWAIKGNYLEADAENFMCGGSDPAIADLVVADIEFIGNLCSKPLTWNPFHASFAGIYYNVANLFELKSARRVLIIENTFEHNWRSVQAGAAIVFTTKNQSGYAPQSVVEDVSFLNNVIDGVHSGFSISGDDGGAGEIPPRPSMGGQRIRIHNNFIHDVGGNAWGEDSGHYSTVFNCSGGMRYVTIQHNTIVQTPASPNVDGLLITAGGAAYDDFRFQDNICHHNTYGVKGAATGVGNATLYVWFPSCLFEKNILIAGSAGNYPANNYFPATKTDVHFRNPASDYRLDPSTVALSDLTTSLTSFWPLEANANDAQSTNHLTTVGTGITFSADGVDLEETGNCCATIGDNPALSSGDVDWSFNVWCRPEDLTVRAGFPFIASKGWIGTQDINSEWGIAQNGVNQPLVFAVRGGTTQTECYSPSALVAGNVYMVTVAHSATLNEIWIAVNKVKGTPVSHSAGVNDGNRAFVLGSGGASNALTWDGLLHRAAFYKGRVLTQTNMDDLYNSGAGLSLAEMQAGSVPVCPYVDVATDEGPLGAPDSVIEEL